MRLWKIELLCKLGETSLFPIQSFHISRKIGGAILFISPERNYLPTHDVAEFKLDDVESIYFTQQSRVGVVYDIDTKGVFGFRDNDKYIIRITENIGVASLRSLNPSASPSIQVFDAICYKPSLIPSGQYH